VLNRASCEDDNSLSPSEGIHNWYGKSQMWSNGELTRLDCCVNRLTDRD